MTIPPPYSITRKQNKTRSQKDSGHKKSPGERSNPGAKEKEEHETNTSSVIYTTSSGQKGNTARYHFSVFHWPIKYS
jgi:hypothetical protein